MCDEVGGWGELYGGILACGFLWCRMVFIRLFKEIVCSPTYKPPYSTTSSSIIIANLSMSLELFAIILQVYFFSYVFVTDFLVS